MAVFLQDYMTDFEGNLELFKESLSKKELECFQATSYDDLIISISSAEREMATKRKLLNFRRLEPFLRTIENYIKITEVKVALSVESSVFIWGPMKLLLQVSSADFNVFNDLLDFYEWIGEHLPLTLQSPVSLKNSLAMRVLPLVYDGVLSFHMQALLFFSIRSWKQLSDTVWRRYKTNFKNIITPMASYRNLVGSDLGLGDTKNAIDFRKLTEAKLNYRRRAEDFRRQQHVMKWLNVEDDGEDHYDYTPAVHHIVKMQLYNNQIFNEWLQPQSDMKPPLLLLAGISGPGRNVLGPLVVGKAKGLESRPSVLISHPKKDSKNNSFLSIARSLLVQLLNHNISLLNYLFNISNSSYYPNLTSRTTAQTLLGVAFLSCNNAYVIINGFEEYSREEQMHIAKFFKTLANERPLDSDYKFRCMFTSQRSKLIHEDFSDLSSITIDMEFESSLHNPSEFRPNESKDSPEAFNFLEMGHREAEVIGPQEIGFQENVPKNNEGDPQPVATEHIVSDTYEKSAPLPVLTKVDKLTVNRNFGTSYEDSSTRPNSSSRSNTTPSYEDTSSKTSFTFPENVQVRLKQHKGLKKTSVISDETASESSGSSYRSTEISRAEALIVKRFAHDSQLKRLCADALSVISREKLIINLRRLLHAYYNDLLIRVNSNLELATASLFNNRRARTRIASHIVDNVSPSQETIHKETALQIEKIQLDEDYLERWIRSNPAFFVTEDSNDSVEGDEDSSDSDSSNSVIFKAEHRSVPNIAEMESFLLSGAAFRSLLFHISSFLLPSGVASLGRTLAAVPAEHIWILTSVKPSISDEVKVFVENLTKESWSWWPLAKPTLALATSHVRINWHCQCGKKLSHDVTEKEADLLKIAVDSYLPLVSRSQLCQPSKSPANGKIYSLIDFLIWSLKTATGSDVTQNSRPSQSGAFDTGSDHSSLRTVEKNTTDRSDEIDSAVTGVPYAGSNIGIPIPEIKEPYVLFAVQGRRRTLETTQISINKNPSDLDFFHHLRAEYPSLRGWLLYWFSMWQLSHCNFVKFLKYKANRVISLHEELPDHPDYEYRPKPAEDIPPISVHEFEEALHPCRHPCRLSFFHDCKEPLQGCSGVERMPKCSKLLSLKAPQREFVWGIEAKFRIAFVYVLIYHMIALSAPISIWIWWQTNHPGDFQNGATILIVELVPLSFIWAVLLSGRLELQNKQKAE